MPTKVAIIGSGLAGLTAAYILSNDPDKRFEVTIYEKHASFGIDSSSFSVPIEGIDTKGEERIDVPLRVVYRQYYSSLFKLFEHIRMTFSNADLTFSFSKLSPPTPNTPSLPTTYFSESRLDVDLLGFRFPIPNPPTNLTVFQTSQIAADWYRLRTYSRLIYHASYLDTLKGQTVGEFLRAHEYSDSFTHVAFMPAMAGIFTCSYESTMRIPADIVVDYIAKVFLDDRAVKVKEGVKTLCKRLTEKVEVMRFGCGVKSIHCVQEIEGKKKVVIEDDTSRSETFDSVIFATQADQARRILSASPTFPLTSATAIPPALLRTLGSFVYESTSVVTHTDPSFMPRDRRDWDSVNVFMPAQGTTQADVPEGCYPDQPMTTCWMNQLMPGLKGQPDIFQTVNPLLPIPTGTAQLQPLALLGRVVPTNATASMLDALDDLQSTNNLYFVGSYTYPGVPLLEGCVQSAVRVARLMLAEGDLASEKIKQEASKVIPWANEDEGMWEKGRLMKWYFNERERRRKTSGKQEGGMTAAVAQGLLRMSEYRVVGKGMLILWNMFMLVVVAFVVGAIAIGMGVRDTVKWIRARSDSEVVCGEDKRQS